MSLTGADPASIPDVPLEPVPISVLLGQADTADGKRWVLVRVSMPAGVAVYFLPPDNAVQLAVELDRIGKAARTGLVLPTTPNGQPSP